MKQISMRDAFFNRFYELARQDRDIILISADMGAPSLDKYRHDLSSQYINIGIAEQNMITVAAGLALSGKKVFTYAIMPFITLRCFEITRVDLSMMNLPVTLIGVGAGFSYDDSGPTHHSPDDISVMRVLPHLTIWNASDSVMASACADLAYANRGPSYVRLDREVLPAIYEYHTDFSAGLERKKVGSDVTIIATGNMVHKALQLSDELAEQSIEAGVVDLYRLKPVNEAVLLQYIAEANLVVTLEEHFLAGGMGSIVAEVMADHGVMKPIKRFGIPDKHYYIYGSRENIQAVCGIDVKTVSQSVQEWVKTAIIASR